MNPNENEPGQEDDIFPPSIQPHPAPPASPSRPAASAKVVKRSTIKPAYVFGAAAVAVMFWVFGVPMLSSPKPAQQATGLSDRDSELQTYKRRHSGEAASDTAPSLAPADDPFAQPASAVAAAAAPAASQMAVISPPAAIPAPASSVTVASDPTGPNQTATLKSRIATLEIALQDAATCAPTRHAVVAHTSSAQRHPHAAKTAAPALEEASTSDLGVLPGYRLNTIYRGQAWIEHAQKTYVVEAGQDFDGLQVIRVDAKGRRVLTAQGEIR